MTSTTPARLLAVAFVSLLVTACGSRGGPARLTPDAQYEQAMRAYDQGKYGRATVLLQGFLDANVGDPRSSRARLALGRARLARGEALPAASEFTRLLNDFPADTLGRQARFGLCEAYHDLSPAPPRDQQYTSSAIAYCESYAGLFPASAEAGRARGWMTELRGKLAEKLYNTGLFYFRRGAYDAGVISFTQTVEQFADTRWAPAALLKLFESYQRIGYKEEAEEASTRLRTEFPQSPETALLPAPAPAVAPDSSATAPAPGGG